jgi:hypothetical protein
VRPGLSPASGGNGQHVPFSPILAAGAVGSDALPGFARQFQAVRDGSPARTKICSRCLLDL